MHNTLFFLKYKRETHRRFAELVCHRSLEDLHDSYSNSYTVSTVFDADPFGIF